jgi:hypothetical protein
MTFTERCDDSVYRPVEIDVRKVTGITKLADARHQNTELDQYKAYSSIVHDGREILLLESFESVIAALEAAQKCFIHLSDGIYYVKLDCERKNIKYQVERTSP